MKRTAVVLILWAVITPRAMLLAQSSASTVLQASLAAQGATNQPINDATVSGTAESIAGSDDETAPFVFKGLSDGYSRTEIALSRGTTIEIRTITASGPAGSWSRGDTVQHAMAGHNVLTDAAWWFPLFVVQRLATDPNANVTYVGIDSGFAHFRASQKPPANLPPTVVAQVTHITEIHLYIDPATTLPARLDFNIHPDKNASIDILVSIRFSDYQQVNGLTIPFRIQKYINNTLALDAHVQSASVNTGLTTAECGIN